jgi:hypothetical protein
MQCNEADWNCTLTIWYWVKLFAQALGISIAMSAVVAGAAWFVAQY